MQIADLTIATTDFEPGGRIPERMSADGGNEAPRLSVSGVPAGAVELAVVVHDPDAPMPRGYTHWVRYGIAAQDGEVPVDGRTGVNNAGQTDWFGPQPPAGHGDHHYYCWVYALSRPVEGEPTREEFLDRYADAIIEQNRVIGTFSR